MGDCRDGIGYFNGYSRSGAVLWRYGPRQKYAVRFDASVCYFCLDFDFVGLYGYSVAFTEGNAFFGGLSKAFLKGCNAGFPAATFSKGVYIPEYIYIAFQLTFSAITPALIIGAFAERVKFSAVLLFTMIMVYLFLFADSAYGLVLGRTGCLYRCRCG